jgi:hypothetical protein
MGRILWLLLTLAPGLWTSRELVVQEADALISGAALGQDGNAERAIEGATVTLTSTDGRRLEIQSDLSGNFVFHHLGPGRYVLRLSKPGFVSAEYGAARPGRPGIPIVIDGVNRNVEGLTVRLVRGAVVSGRVTDKGGQPLRGVTVGIAQRGSPNAATANLLNGPTEELQTPTDDTGRYRLYGIPEGSYIVKARSLGAAARSDGSAYAPTYYAFAADSSEAIPLELREGKELDGIDIVLREVHTFAIGGRIVGPTGDLRLELTPSPGYASRTTVRADGTFVVANAVPGHYDVLATMYAPRVRSAPASFGRTAVDVLDRDVKGITLFLHPTSTLSGHMTTDALSASAAGQVSIGLVADGQRRPESRIAVVADGTVFSAKGIVPGKYYLVCTTCSITPTSGQIVAVSHDGQDVLGSPIEFVTGQDIAQFSVTLGTSGQELSGTVRDTSGHLAPGCTLVLFPRNSQYWNPYSGRVLSARSGTDGSFLFIGFPSGDYFVAVVDDFGPEDVDARTFADLVRSSLSVAIQANETKKLDIVIPTSQVGSPNGS